MSNINIPSSALSLLLLLEESKSVAADVAVAFAFGSSPLVEPDVLLAPETEVEVSNGHKQNPEHKSHE
jgi:hypothetical protein